MAVSLRRSFLPRRRVTLLEPGSTAGGRAFIELAESRAEIQYRSGLIRLAAEGTLERVVQLVIVRIPRHEAVAEGWRIRDERNARVYRIVFVKPLGAERVTELHCELLR